jgi:hypothetical protein
MKDNSYEPFTYYSDVRLPEKFRELLAEAKKEGKGNLSVLIVKDEQGTQYEITVKKDRENVAQKYLKNLSSLDLRLLSYLKS